MRTVRLYPSSYHSFAVMMAAVCFLALGSGHGFAAAAPGEQAGEERAYAPICIIPFTVPAESRSMYNGYQAVSALTERVTRYLSNLGVPVVGTGLRSQTMSEDSLHLLLQQMSERASLGQLGARYVLTGTLTDLKSDNNGALSSIKLEAVLRDVRTTQPVKRFTVSGGGGGSDSLKEIGKNLLDRVLRNNKRSNGANDRGAQEAANDAMFDKVSQSLAKQVLAAYPDTGPGDDPLSRPARWSVPVEGAGDAEALRTAVEKVTRRLATPRALNQNAALLRTEILSKADQFARLDRTHKSADVFLTAPSTEGKRALPQRLEEIRALQPLRLVVTVAEAPRTNDPGDAERRRFYRNASVVGGTESIDSVAPAQAELVKRLKDAGFDLRSQDREKQIREAHAFKELLRSDPDPAKLRTLRKEIDADVLLIVRATSEPVEMYARGSEGVQAQAWVGVTGYRLDTARIVAASDWNYPGRGLTPESARVAALKNAAAATIPDVVESLYKNGYGNAAPEPPSATTGSGADSEPISVTLEGWSGYSEAKAFVSALKTVNGVHVVDWKFTDAKLTCTVKTDGNVDLGEALEKSPALKKFRVVVKSAESREIVGSVKP